MADHFKGEEEERRIIIDKYERGREKVLEKDGIDEWEDPGYELYHVVDRYGFIHDNKLPEKLTKHENEIRDLEAKRSYKWCKMIGNWSSYKKKNFDKLRERVFKGIPNAVRGNAWLLLLDVPQIKKEHENRYDEMYNLGKQYSKEVRQIDLDINRTFRNNIMFRERYNVKQQELFRVLVAYSVYNSEIGYCQGMSQIAALLLMFTSEEDTFWALDRLMTADRYAMHGFFVPGFPKLDRFAKHHDLVLKKFLNKVYKHFRKYDIQSTLYTLKWFFQCFLDRVPFSLTLRLWDCFMMDGERILTCMSYTLLKLHKKSILKKNMDYLIPFLQIDLEKDFGYFDDETITELQKSIELLHKYKMDVPLEAASDLERPSKPFGLISQTDETVSIINDDRSMVESEANCKPFHSDRDDDVSAADTSRTSSEIDADDYKDEDLNDDLMNEHIYSRKLSVYDNIDLNESFEAVKRMMSLTNESRDQNEATDATKKQSNSHNMHQETNDVSCFTATSTLNECHLQSMSEAIKQSSNEHHHHHHSQTIARETNPVAKVINEHELDDQSKYTQLEKKETFITNDETVNECPSSLCDDQLQSQNKTTSSLKDRSLSFKKSSIPTLRRTESQQRKEVLPIIGSPIESTLDRSIDTLDNESISLSPTSKQTPIKSSLIPRLSNSTSKSISKTNNHSMIANSIVTNSVIKSNNNDSMKASSHYSKGQSDTSIENVSARPIKIYVPYAEIASKNSSRNSLTSSTNSITNLSNGVNGLKNRKNDLNKITISVNQQSKYIANESSPMKTNMKSYLPTIDT